MTAPRMNHKSLVCKPNSKTKTETRIYSALLLTLAILVLLATHLTQQPAPWGSGSPASKTSLVRARGKQFLAGKHVYGDAVRVLVVPVDVFSGYELLAACPKKAGFGCRRTRTPGGGLLCEVRRQEYKNSKSEKKR